MGDLAGWLAAWLACVAAWGWATERRRLAAALRSAARADALRLRRELADARAELTQVPARWVCRGCGRLAKSFTEARPPPCGCGEGRAGGPDSWVAL